MTNQDSVEQALKGIPANREFFKPGTPETDLNRLAMAFATLEQQLQEKLANESEEAFRNLLCRLENDVMVSPDDIDLMVLWMKSDIEFCNRLRADLPDRLAELNRLMGDLDKLRNRSRSKRNLARLSAATRDAIRILEDVLHFRQLESQITSFEKLTQGSLSAPEKLKLAQMLRPKLGDDDPWGSLEAIR